MPDREDITLDIEASSPQSEREVGRGAQAWMERCPVYLALLGPMRVATTVAIRSA